MTPARPIIYVGCLHWLSHEEDADREDGNDKEVGEAEEVPQVSVNTESIN